MPDRKPQGSHAPHAKTEEVGLLDSQLPEEGGDIFHKLLGRDRAFNIAGSSVSLKLDGDHLVVLREGGPKRLEIREVS